MKLLKEKFETLKGLLVDAPNSDNKEVKIGIAINELQSELKIYREIEIYKQDYSDCGWSFMLNNDKIDRFMTYTREQ